MISSQQQLRALAEFESAARAAESAARLAEKALEQHSMLSAPAYSPSEHGMLLYAFQESDYQAESLAWVAQLIRTELAATLDAHRVAENAAYEP